MVCHPTLQVPRSTSVAFPFPRRLTLPASLRLALAVIVPAMTLLALLVALTLSALPAHAAGSIWYVAPGRVDLDCTQSKPCGSIQTAVGLVHDGDEIRVAAGIYTDVHAVGALTQVVYLSKSLTLRGGYAYTSSADYDWTTSLLLNRPTILDAQGKGRVIYIAANVTATVEGFNVTNGSWDQGGGI